MNKKAHVVVPKNHGVSWLFRVWEPLSKLGAQSSGLSIDFDNISFDSVVGADVVILSEADSPESELFVSHAQAIGAKVIVDIDDDVFSLLPSMAPFGDFYRRGSGEPTDRLRYLIRCLRLADLVTVSTQELQKVYSGVAKGIAVVRNELNLDTWRRVNSRKKESRTIGWMGTYNHWDDLAMVMPILNRLLAVRPDVGLSIVGFPESRVLLNPAFHDRCRWRPWTDRLSDVADEVGSWDVAIAPLFLCRFNLSKSDLKLLHYGACRLPVVASRYPYQDTIVADTTGLLADGADEWMKQLLRLLDDSELRQTLGSQLAAYVEEQRHMQVMTQRWLQVIQGVARP